MRKQVEILVYQYKKRNNLGVNSPLTWADRKDLLMEIEYCIGRIRYKNIIDEERIRPTNV